MGDGALDAGADPFKHIIKDRGDYGNGVSLHLVAFAFITLSAFS
ncbi:hypothetical protein HRbin02_01706 [Candidatus Calditenuaceae archaeon HR02]|nr:hypothetical protein HRbin02_01706 [Candidatus Calditenuaceae archaeon HR02]